MDKKTIFITGAGRGIGKATAQLFAQKGWFVGLSDINQQEMVITLFCFYCYYKKYFLQRNAKKELTSKVRRFIIGRTKFYNHNRQNF